MTNLARRGNGGMMRSDMAEHPSRPDPISEEEPGEPDGDPLWRSMLLGDASLDRQLRWQRRLAARHLLSSTADSPHIPAEVRPLPVGIGVHTGTAYVGIVGQAEQKLDFTALGDAVSLTQRLSSVAEAGEILFSDDTVRAARLDMSDLRSNELELKGIGRPVLAWSERRAPIAVA
jgi:class 3 adenylate cyclase